MNISILSFVLVLFISHLRPSSSDNTIEDFVQCLPIQFSDPSMLKLTNLTYTQNNASYSSVLNFSIQNLRFASATTLKPRAIVTPTNEAHIQAVIECSREYGFEIKVRSGGHDFEGQSYTSDVPFVILDLINYRSITIDAANATATVQGGATLGELHYYIAKMSRTLALAADFTPTVGVGGFVSGGGFGPLLRKYGLAADNVLDAIFMDKNGNIYIGTSVGKDVSWAIRGGGGANFGIVLEWKLKLGPVPEKVTVFTIRKNLEQNATQLIYRWQSEAYKFHDDLFVRIKITSVNSGQGGKRTIQASFQSLFLGDTNRLLRLMQRGFPELGLVKEDCIEMSWIESVVYFYSGSQTGQSLDVLLSRENKRKNFFKAKSDYVQEPIPIKALEGLWEFINLEEPGAAEMIWTPHGGKMSRIPASRTPYPHRAGNLFNIHYAVYWNEEGTIASNKHQNWIRRLYNYMTPYVSNSPRGAYVNFRDLDLGVTNRNTSYEEAKSWGTKYFKNNFERLVRVKTMVDSENFFRNEQSLPIFSSGKAT